VADLAGVEGGAVGERAGGREIFAETENEAVRAIVVGGTEETGNDDARGDGAPDGRVGAAAEGEVDVVNDEAVARGGGEEFGAEARGVGGGNFEGGVELGVGRVVVGLEAVVELGGEVLRECDGREAVERAFPGAGDRAAGDDEAEGGVAAGVDAGDDTVDGCLDQVAEADVDAVAGSAVDDPRVAAETVVADAGVDGAVAGFGGADPALFGFGGDHGNRVAEGAERMDEFVKENAVDAVVVGDQ